MTSWLRVLYLEDDTADAELVRDTLAMEGIACDVTSVETESAFRAALEQGGFDVILADYTLPSFDGLSALRIARQQRPDLPFLFVSGTLGEEVAIEALKIGATDYVVKSRLSRLVPSLQRALHEAGVEARLRQDEMELRRIVDAVPQHVFVLDPDGRFVYANRQDLDYTGLTVEDVRAAEYLERLFHPEDLARLREERAGAIAEGVAWESEARLRRFDGQYRWFLIRINPLRDEQEHIIRWYGTRTDIHDRKSAEETIQQQEREMRQILDLAPQYLVAFAPDGSRVYANQAMLDYLGLTLDEWIASDIRRNVHPDDVDAALRFKAQMADGEVEFRLRRHDGTYRWFLVRGSAIRDDGGRLLRLYVAATDIDDRKRAEQRLHDENLVLREDIDTASMFEEIVGASAALEGVLGRVSKVAPTDSTVLITGETGTGKELVARAIHRRSSRAARAFVSVNCAATPRELIASELFGHEKGAFTGATQRRLGRFELAHGGTIFLDEVGELPPETQVALLHVLQEREFERVGGTTPIRVDVRVIAATNRDLSAAIEAGTFRSDLFYRLNVFPIAMPPLRERADDIPLLVEYFIDRFARKVGKTIRRVSRKTLERLRSYPWPGNVRELQNVIERSVIVCDTDEFTVDESWLSVGPAADSSLALSGKLATHEKAMIEEALSASGGRVFGPSGAAARLGIPRSTLESKIRALRIDKRRFRSARPARNP